MEILEKLRAWLGELPFWEGELPEIDKISVKPGSSGLFPLGQQVVKTREDVLGNVTRLVRYTYLLKKTAIPGADSAKWCQMLQTAAKEMPPRLGQKDFYTQGGSYKKPTATGVGMYEIRLIAEMEETYE